MSKVKTYGKQMPKSEARPLGMKKPKLVKGKSVQKQPEEDIESQKVVDTPIADVVDSSQVESNTAIDAAATEAAGVTHMTLTLKALSKNGKRAIYTGAAQSINFNVGLFPGKTAPASIDVADGIFAVKAEKVAKVKLTKDCLL